MSCTRATPAGGHAGRLVAGARARRAAPPVSGDRRPGRTRRSSRATSPVSTPRTTRAWPRSSRPTRSCCRPAAGPGEGGRRSPGTTATILTPFPVHHDEPVQVIVSGADVTVEIAYEGQLANGRAIAFDAVNVYRLEDGAIVRLSQWYDTHRVRRLLLEAQAAGPAGPEPAEPEPRLGSVSRATPQRLRAALALVRRGDAFRLDIPLGQPEPPLFGRDPDAPRGVHHRRPAPQLGRPDRQPQHPAGLALGRAAPPAAGRRHGATAGGRRRISPSTCGRAASWRGRCWSTSARASAWRGTSGARSPATRWRSARRARGSSCARATSCCCAPDGSAHSSRFPPSGARSEIVTPGLAADDATARGWPSGASRRSRPTTRASRPFPPRPTGRCSTTA